jgi:hypothetical protein
MSVLLNRGRPAYLVIISLLLALLPAKAQTPVTLSPYVRQQFFDSSGRPLSFGKICTFAGGTNTPLATYTDASGLFQATNPIILDAGGFASIWISANTYKFMVRTAGTDGTCNTGALQYVIDLVTPAPFVNGNNAWTGNETHSGTETFNGSVVITGGGSLSGTFSGNPAFSGIPAFNGTTPFSVANPVVVANLNAALLNGATFAAPGPIGSTTPSTSAFTTMSATGQITSTLAIGTPPFLITSTTNVPNLNVRNINGVDYPATAPAHSVPVATTANTTATYKVIPDCPGSISFSQSTNSFSCSTTQIATATKTTGCITAVSPASICSDTLTWSTAFADTSYIAVCSGTNVPQGVPGVNAVQNLTTTTVDVVTTNINQGNVSGQYAKISCIGVHP